jgi:uncharacterized protein YcbX
MKVLEIRRYPIKSLLGEQPPAAEVDQRGLTGDRLWAVRDTEGKLGSGKNTRRFRRMPGLFALHHDMTFGVWATVERPGRIELLDDTVADPM